MRAAQGLLLLAATAACSDADTQLFNVFDPATPVEEVPCASSPWRERELPTDKGLADIWGTSEADLWIAGGASLMLHWDGTRWEDRSLELGVDLHALAGLSTDDIWVVGAVGAIAHFDGVGWSVVESGTASDMLGVWPFAANDVWFVGEDGVRHFDGRKISQDPSWPTEQVNAVWASSPTDMRMVSNTAVYHYDGARFETQPIQKAGKLAAVWGTDSNHVYAIGHNTMMRPGFAQLVNGQWLFSGAPPRAFYFSLWSLKSGELWAGANDSTIFYYANESWCREHLGGIGAINAFFGFSNDLVWAVGATRDTATGGSRPIFLERSAR